MVLDIFSLRIVVKSVLTMDGIIVSVFSFVKISVLIKLVNIVDSINILVEGILIFVVSMSIFVDGILILVDSILIFVVSISN